jgi:hypothetical protein
MSRLSDFSDLIESDATVDYSKLDDEFWDGVPDILIENQKKFDEQTKSLIPDHKDLHTLMN